MIEINGVKNKLARTLKRGLAESSLIKNWMTRAKRRNNGAARTQKSRASSATLIS
jgi:hypothetical protein